MNLPKLDDNNPDANMYGCLPCPKCGSRYRWPTSNDAKERHPNHIICDDCGFEEPYDNSENRS